MKFCLPLLFALVACEPQAIDGQLFCNSSKECPKGQVCTDGECQRASAKDGGLADTVATDSAGVADAAVADTARPDHVGPDNPTVDGWSLDSRRPDVATPDSGSPDNRSNDSAAPDMWVSSPDAGVLHNLGTLSVDIGTLTLPDSACQDHDLVFTLSGHTVLAEGIELVRKGTTDITPQSMSGTWVGNTFVTALTLCWDDTVGFVQAGQMSTAFVFQAYHRTYGLPPVSAQVGVFPGALYLSVTPGQLTLPQESVTQVLEFVVSGAPASVSPGLVEMPGLEALADSCQRGEGYCEWSDNTYRFRFALDPCLTLGRHDVRVTDIYGRFATTSITVLENSTWGLEIVVTPSIAADNIIIPNAPAEETDVTLDYVLLGANRNTSGLSQVYGLYNPWGVVDPLFDLSLYGGYWHSGLCNVFRFEHRLHGSIRSGAYGYIIYNSEGQSRENEMVYVHNPTTRLFFRLVDHPSDSEPDFASPVVNFTRPLNNSVYKYMEYKYFGELADVTRDPEIVKTCSPLPCDLPDEEDPWPIIANTACDTVAQGEHRFCAWGDPSDPERRNVWTFGQEIAPSPTSPSGKYVYRLYDVTGDYADVTVVAHEP